MRRILYLQFADPAAYPPIEHSSAIFAQRGWSVVLIGTDTFGNKTLRMPPSTRIRVKKLGVVKSGWRQRLQYAHFVFLSVLWITFWRPHWVYASDLFAAPVAVVAKVLRVRIVYHEHDSPNRDWKSSGFMKAANKCRDVVASWSDLCILPQPERLREFLNQTRRKRPSFCVRNFPRLCEIQETDSQDKSNLIIYYHGSINESRLPLELIVAMSRFRGSVKLRVAGYETAASKGYLKKMARTAAENDAPNLIEWMGTIPLRSELLRSAATADVGLSLMPKASDDINMRYMIGASNKAFDYMACGVPLLISDLPDWVDTFVKPRFAQACDPADPASIAAAVQWYLEHPAERRDMGQRCREQVRQVWNYEAAFAEVLAMIENG